MLLDAPTGRFPIYKLKQKCYNVQQTFAKMQCYGITPNAFLKIVDD